MLAQFMSKCEPLQPVCGLKIVGKVEMNVKTATNQDLYKKFWKKPALRKKSELILIEVNIADSFVCFIMNQTIKNVSLAKKIILWRLTFFNHTDFQDMNSKIAVYQPKGWK